jgi:peptidoglycan/LPS O-acetylase OafA/YrhL
MKRNIDFSNNKQRIVSLDGLRGVAVLMVLFFHYLNNSFNNAGDGKLNKIELFLKKITYWGWAGVDLFFILSGFLIASILISNRESRTFFKNFLCEEVLEDCSHLLPSDSCFLYRQLLS